MTTSEHLPGAQVSLGAKWTDLDWVDVNDPRAEQLEGVEVIKAFRNTARDLDIIGSDKTLGGSYPWDHTQEPLYQGLIWLKQRADESGLVITGNRPYEDMTPEEKLLYEALDPMKNWLVAEMLLGDENS